MTNPAPYDIIKASKGKRKGDKKMKNYRVEMMTGDNYGKYMMGESGCPVEHMIVEAKSAEEAVEIVKRERPEMVINESFVKTLDELAEEAEIRKANWENFLKEEEERKAKRKAKREADERAKAKAAGMTIEEYKAEVNKVRKIKKLEKEIAELAKALDAKKELLKKLK